MLGTEDFNVFGNAATGQHRDCQTAFHGSVLVAVLAPLAVTGDNGARLALLTTAGLMLLLKKPLPAIAAGIVAAALLRQLSV